MELSPQNGEETTVIQNEPESADIEKESSHEDPLEVTGTPDNVESFTENELVQEHTITPDIPEIPSESAPPEKDKNEAVVPLINSSPENNPHTSDQENVSHKSEQDEQYESSKSRKRRNRQKRRRDHELHSQTTASSLSPSPRRGRRTSSRSSPSLSHTSPHTHTDSSSYSSYSYSGYSSDYSSTSVTRSSQSRSAPRESRKQERSDQTVSSHSLSSTRSSDLSSSPSYTNTSLRSPRITRPRSPYPHLEDQNIVKPGQLPFLDQQPTSTSVSKRGSYPFNTSTERNVFDTKHTYMENEQVIADRKRNRNHRKKTMWKDHLDYTHKLAAQFEEKRRDGEDLSTDSEGMRRIEQARLIDEKEKLLWGVYGEGELGDSELLLRAKMQAGRRSGRERTKSQERTDEAEEPENTARSNAKSQTGNKTERAMSSFVERQMQDAERRREIQKLLEKEKEEREQRIQNKEFETECKQRSKPTQNLSESELAEIRIKTQKASELRRQKLAQEKKERLEKEKKNMTFHPKINPSPSNTTPRPRSSIEDTVARLSAVKGPKRIRKTTPTKPKPKPQRPKTVSTQRERPSPRLSRKERERMIVECVERMEEDRIDRKIKEELRKEEMHSAECPFHPQLSPNTQRLAKLSETRQLNSTMQTFTSQHSNNTTPTHQRPLSKSQAQTLQRQRVLEMGEQRARKMWETEEERKRKKRMKELFAAIYLASSGKDGKSVDGFVLPVEVRDIVGRMGNDGKLRTEKQTTNKNGEETDRSCRPDSTGETFQNDTMHERTNLSERELQTTTKEDIGNDQKDEREQQTTLDEVTIETHSHHTPSSRSLSPPHTLHVTSSSSTSPSHASTHPNVVASHTHSSSISSYEMTTPIVSNAPSHIASPEPPHPAHSTTRLVEHPHTVPSSELNDESVDERTQRSQTDDDSLSADLGKFNQEALIFISHFLKSWIVNFVQQLQSHPDTSQTLTFHAFLKRCRAEKKRNDEKGIPTSNDVIMRPGQPLFEDDTRRREEIDRVLKRMRIVVERKGKGNDEQIELKQHEEEEGSERKKSEVFERLAANGKRIGMEMKTRHDSEKKREQQAAKRREEIFTLSHLQKRNEKSVEKSTADPALFERLSQRKEIVLKKDSEDDALANQTRMMDGFLKLLRSSSPVNTQKIEKKQRRTIKEKSYPEKMHDLFSRMAATPD